MPLFYEIYIFFLTALTSYITFPPSRVLTGRCLYGKMKEVVVCLAHLLPRLVRRAVQRVIFLNTFDSTKRAISDICSGLTRENYLIKRRSWIFIGRRRT